MSEEKEEGQGIPSFFTSSDSSESGPYELFWDTEEDDEKESSSPTKKDWKNSTKGEKEPEGSGGEDSKSSGRNNKKRKGEGFDERPEDKALEGKGYVKRKDPNSFSNKKNINAAETGNRINEVGQLADKGQKVSEGAKKAGEVAKQGGKKGVPGAEYLEYGKDAKDLAEGIKDKDSKKAGKAVTRAGVTGATDALTAGQGGKVARMVMDTKVGGYVVDKVGTVVGLQMKATVYLMILVVTIVVLLLLVVMQLLTVVAAFLTGASGTTIAASGGVAAYTAFCEDGSGGGSSGVVNTDAQVSESEEENAKTIYVFLISNGVTRAGAAGILGNIQEESRFNPSAIEGGSGEGHGLVQWSFSRRLDLMMRANSKRVKWDDMAFQLDFLLYEMRLPYYKTTWDIVTTVKDPSDAAYEFHRLFERSADTRSMIQERLDAAVYWAERFKDVKPVDGVKVAAPEDDTSSEGEVVTEEGEADPDASSEPAALCGDEGGAVNVGNIPVDPNGWGLPMATYTLTSPFGPRDGGPHNGLDFSSGNGTNEPIVAVRGGAVTQVFSGCNYVGRRGDRCGGGYGNYVVIDHGDGYQTLYAHLYSTNVKAGDEVKRGQVLGKQGSTGDSSGNHLHFELKRNGTAIDPQSVMQIPTFRSLEA